MFKFRKEQRVSSSVGKLEDNKNIHKKAKKIVREFRKLAKKAHTMPSEPSPSVHVEAELYEYRGYQTGVVTVSSWLGGAHSNHHTYSWTTNSSGCSVDLVSVVDIPCDAVLHELEKAVKDYCKETGLQDPGKVTLDLCSCWRPKPRKNVAGEWEQGVELHFDSYAIGSYVDGEHKVFVPLPLNQSNPSTNRPNQRLAWIDWLSLLAKLALRLQGWLELLCGWFDSVLSCFSSARQAAKQQRRGAVA